MCLQLSGRPCQGSSPCFPEALSCLGCCLSEWRPRAWVLGPGWFSSPPASLILQFYLPCLLITMPHCLPWINNLFMIWNKSQTSPHCGSSGAEPASHSSKGWFYFSSSVSSGTGWGEGGWGLFSRLVRVMAVLASASASQPQGGTGPGWALSEGPGDSTFPGTAMESSQTIHQAQHSMFSMWVLHCFQSPKNNNSGNIYLLLHP